MGRDTTIRNMWNVASDLENDDAGDVAGPGKDRAEGPPGRELPSQDVTPQRRSGRVKTRLLGVDHSNGALETIESMKAVSPAEQVRFAVGWLAVVAGPGTGAAFALGAGVSQIGRSDDQAISLDFGDLSISRDGHAFVAFDPETKQFFIGHGGKANLVRLNGKPVLSTETMAHGDRIRIGETTLMLAALCGADFAWAAGDA